MMIGFAGLSHLGLVSSAAAASTGLVVVGFDPDAALVAALKTGHLPVSEPGLRGLIAGESRPSFTAEAAALSRCDVVYIALDVPTTDTGQSDLTGLVSLIDLVWPHLRRDAVLVLLSQVPPGFTRQLEARRASSSDGPGAIYYQVETLIFGNAVARALHPERYIVGCADPAAPMPETFLTVLEPFGCPVIPMRYESAEFAKISINCFLVSSLSTTNLLAEVCEQIGADWSEIAPALRLDARIGPKAYLGPGLGFGGGNLGRDLNTVKRLAGEHGTDARIIDSWLANSRYRRDWALRLLHARILDVRPDTAIGVWGLAYKPDTAFMKNSPAIALLEALPGRQIRAYDPAARLERATFPTVLQVDDAIAACRGTDVLMVMTPWVEFRSIPAGRIREAMRGRQIIDPYGALDSADTKTAGFEHYRLGEAWSAN